MSCRRRGPPDRTPGDPHDPDPHRRPPTAGPPAEAAGRDAKAGEPKPESHRETVESIVVRLHPRPADPRLRGRGVRDPDRLDGPDPDGPAQGGRLPAVRRHLRRQRRRTRPGPAVPVVLRDLRQLPVPHAEVDDLPSFNGDRILVMKFPYELPCLPLADRPERWDVVVFHYPEEPEQNYIKRLVGLPGEELMIRGGDLYARPLGDRRARSRSSASRCGTSGRCSMLVYDDRYRPPALGRPARVAALGPAGARRLVRGRRTSPAPSSPAAEAERRRLAPLPPPRPRPATSGGRLSDGRDARDAPAPVADHRLLLLQHQPGRRRAAHRRRSLEPHWVGDLTVRFDLEVEAAGGPADRRADRGRRPAPLRRSTWPRGRRP